jgi:hypothetical protein
LFKQKHYINLISSGLLFFISLLFLLKYLPRYTHHPLLIIVVYILIFITGLFKIEKFITGEKSANKKYFYAGMCIIILFLFFAVRFIPKSLQVDRAIEIGVWLSNLKAGIFPYTSIPSSSALPFMFYFISPFYFAGDIGYFVVFGLLLFMLLLIQSSNSKKELSGRMFLLFILPVIYYELLTRSELFTNAVLVVVLISLADKFSDYKKFNAQFLFFALFAGALISTRIILMIPFVLFILFFFRNDFKKVVIFKSIMVLTFCLFLLPFFLWDMSYFLTEKFWAIQFLHLPVWIIVLLVLIYYYTGWMIADLQELFFSSGIFLFINVSISFLIIISKVGFYQALFKGNFDISYYALCIPFLILAIKEYKVDWSLGKVMPVEKN